MPSPSRQAIAILLTAAGYFLAGKLSQILAIPSGGGVTIWLPAGMALAVLLLAGSRMWPGVALGSFAVHSWYFFVDLHSPSVTQALIVAIGFALSAVTRSLLGAWLVRRYVGSPGPLDRARDIALFLLLGGGVACLVDTSLRSLLVLAFGWNEPGPLFRDLWGWWLGEVLGAVIAAPVILTFAAEPHKLWRSRRISLGAPLIGLLVLTIIFQYLANGRETDRLARVFQHRAMAIADDLALHLEQHLDAVRATATLMQVEDKLGSETLALLASQFVEPMPGIRMVQVLVRSPRTEPADSDTLVLADDPDFFYRVRLIARSPAAASMPDQAPGLARPDPSIMQLARDTAAAVATPPMKLVREGKHQRSILVLVPVYDSRTGHSTVEERRQGLHGFVIAQILIDLLVDDALHQVSMADMTMQLMDQTERGRERLLYEKAIPEPVKSLFESRAHLMIAGRQWTVALLPSVGAVQLARSGQEHLLLISELLVACLLGALLLLLTGQSARVQVKVVEQASALNQVEHMLERTEFLRRLADANIIGIEICDPDGGIYDANDAFLDILGYTREELKAGLIRWDRLTPPEWEEADRHAVEHSQGTGVVPAWEKEFFRKDGSRVPVMLGVARLDDPNNRFVAFVVDLTKVKAAEAELKRQTIELERYKLIINSTPMPIFAKEYRGERQGVYLLSNFRSAELLLRADLVGLTDYDLFAREEAERMRQDDLTVLSRREPLVLDESVVDVRNGKPIHLLSTKIPLFDDGGSPYAIACIAMDITEQKLLTERLAALVDAIPDVMFRMNAEGVLLDFKNNRDNSLGLEGDSDSFIGKSLHASTLPEDTQRLILEAIAQAIATGEVQEREYSRRMRQGVRYHEARIVKSGNDEAVVLVRDITEARRTRAALEAANAKLRLANDELKEFAYVASHDLQEPLRTVRSFVELLERRYQDAFDDKGKKWLEFITSGTQRMRDLIDDLLAYSRAGQTGSAGAEHAGKRLDRELLDISKLVRDILRDMRASIEAAGAEIEVGELPSVWAYPIELRQVFQNLISNALKFRRPDVKPRVSITAQASDSLWSFLVADNGIGIEPQYHERIFQVFQRLHGRDKYPGTGIGLAVVKKIVERRGGTLGVLSTPGQGTTFQFTWPSTIGPGNDDTDSQE